MDNTIMLTFCSLFYSFILLFSVIKKNYKKQKEKRILKYLVVSNFCAILAEISCWFCATNLGIKSIFTVITTRIFLILLSIWISLLTIYVCEISLKENKSLKKIISNFVKVCMIIFIILELILPMKLNINPTYASGLAANTIFYFSEFYVALSFFLMLKNGKNIDFKKYAPLFIYFAGGLLMMILQSMRPDWLLANAIDTFVTFLIFLNIENEVRDKKAGDK